MRGIVLMRTVMLGVLLCLTCLGTPAMVAQQPGSIAFEGARVIIGDGRVIDNGVLLVSGGRITNVGRMGEVQRPAGATRVDLTGKTVMPTIVDAHMHIGYENMSSWRAENYTRENIIETLDRLAYYGVGGVF